MNRANSGEMNSSIHIRKATPVDVPRLEEIIEASVRGLQPGYYSPDRLKAL